MYMFVSFSKEELLITNNRLGSSITIKDNTNTEHNISIAIK